MGGRRFRQVQLLLPDHADEGALLDELGRHIPPDAWLVTYNGRGFDWPLLVDPLPDGPPGGADRSTATSTCCRSCGGCSATAWTTRGCRRSERTLLGLTGVDDVDGWEIPGRYLGFLRGGPAEPLAAVVRHNDEDVRSLARLLAHSSDGSAIRRRVRSGPVGDLAGLARAFVRERRLEEALDCLDAALDAERDHRLPRRAKSRRATDRHAGPEEPWWSPRRRADFGGPPRPGASRTGLGPARGVRPTVGRGSGSPSIGRICCDAWAVYDEAVEAWTRCRRRARTDRGRRLDRGREAARAPTRAIRPGRWPPSSAVCAWPTGGAPGDAGTGARGRPSPSLATLA